MAFWIKANGEVTKVEPKNGSNFTLEELHRLVDGYIKIVPANKPNTMLVINEEGKLNDLPVNILATALYVHGAIDPIVGDVLWCSNKEIK